MKKILTIVGPTATGKTDLGIRLAKHYNGEIISADSRQVYRGLDLISGKIPSGEVTRSERGFWEVDGVRIWMLDMASPLSTYSVFDYINDGREVLADIWNRGMLPILVGGTGYYIRGLLEGIENVGVGEDQEIRKRLNALSVVQLQEELCALSSTKWSKMNVSDQNNKIRLIRAIEIETSSEKVDEKGASTPLPGKLDLLEIGLDTSVEVLKKRILNRLDQRIEMGMIDEAKRLVDDGLGIERMEALGLECRYLARFLDERLSLGEMKDELAIKIFQYAKRQRTWFRADKNIHWFDVEDPGWPLKVEKTVSDWYN